MLSFIGFMYIKAKLTVQDFLKNERGEVNVIAIIVLIAVAVALALLFKDQISELIETLIGKITTKAGNAIDGM